MRSFRTRLTKRTKRAKPCDWCGEEIAVGMSQWSYGWSDGCDSGFCYMHPECYEASAGLDDDHFTPGDFQRGSLDPR